MPDSDIKIQDLKTEVKEVYDSLDKIRDALSDGKITSSEAITMMEAMNTIATDLPQISQQGRDIIDAAENKIEGEIAEIQHSKVYAALQALKSDGLSLLGIANVLYAIVELILPSTTADTTHTQPVVEGVLVKSEDTLNDSDAS